jgi:hypothetical protein
MKHAYVPHTFSRSSLAIVQFANVIIEEYQDQGFTLTLRQLYYQFVSRDRLDNTQREYKRLGKIVNDARLAGAIDWDAIVDRGRNLIQVNAWDRPEDIVHASAQRYKIDLWAPQPNYVEVWIEKEALAGVFDEVCRRHRVPLFPCKGYTSQSEMRTAGHYRLRPQSRRKEVTILHFGDHDPSGIDMTRDIADRLSMFAGTPVNVQRLALNRDQIDRYGPPPNPAKITDSRFAGYVRDHGVQSWELDALDPKILSELVSDNVVQYLDMDLWRETVAVEEAQKASLVRVSENYHEIVNWLNHTHPKGD